MMAGLGPYRTQQEEILKLQNMQQRINEKLSGSCVMIRILGKKDLQKISQTREDL
jgi:hypothetical protein